MGIPQIGTGSATPLPYGLRRAECVEQRRQSTTSLIPRGRALFWEGEHQAQKIKIVEGVIRAVRLLENGNRQILAFYWPGDVVMPTQSSCQRITAEAVTNCRVQRTAVSGICQQDEPCGAHQVLAETLALVVTMSSEKQHGPHCELPLAHSKSFACRPETAVCVYAPPSSSRYCGSFGYVARNRLPYSGRVQDEGAH